MPGAGSLDGGSDLSELSDPGSAPATPGQAPTPQTSPFSSARPLPSVTASTTPVATGRTRASRRTSNGAAHASTSNNDGTTASAEDAVVQNRRRSSAKKWEYAAVPERNIFAESSVEGKRPRKQVAQYGRESSAQARQPGRRSSSARMSQDPETASKPSTSPAEDRKASGAATKLSPELGERRTKSKLKLKARLKRKSNAAAEVEQSSKTAKDPEGLEADDEVVQPSKRQKKGVAKGTKEGEAPPSTADLQVEDEKVDGEESMPRRRAGRPRVHHEKRKAKRRKGMARRKSGGENVSDGYQEDSSSADENFSDDADDDFDQGAGKKASRRSSPSKEVASTSRPLQKPPRKLNKQPRPSTGSAIVPAKDLAANITTSASGSSAKAAIPASGSTMMTPSATPTLPSGAPKNVVRKSTGSSVLANLMGYGGPSSRDGTPSRNTPARPRPAAGAASSPGVRHGGVQQTPKRSVEAAGLAISGNRNSNGTGSPHLSSSGMRGTLPSQSSENPGLTGKHVTAEQIAAQREKELKANACPRDLFDLLEGAELMMEFEDETRQRLSIDPFLHKHKLYRPGRTEGMWKLIERIKENEGDGSRLAGLKHNTDNESLS